MAVNGDSRTPVFLTARWRRLVMLNFSVDPGVLRPLAPRGTEVDSWEGATYASLVGFRFLGTKVMGLPLPFHRSFEEINLRFYVRRRGPEGWRRGVVFASEVVPRRAIAAVARWLYNERYVARPTRSTVEDPAGGIPGRAVYRWRHRGEWLAVGARFSGEPAPPGKGSLEEFITEHYWGYTSQRDGGTLEYRVEHPQWKVWRGAETVLAGDLAGFYGGRFAAALSGGPASAFVATGSEVAVRRGRRLALREGE